MDAKDRTSAANALSGGSIVRKSPNEAARTVEGLAKI
jgi:hypothetical protein